MSRTVTRAVMVLLTSGLMACSAAPGKSGRTAPPPDAGPPSTSPPDAGPPAATATADYAGVYATTTPIDLTQSGVLPGALGPALSALRELHDHPGQAILDLVAAADIPTLSSAVQGLPALVRDLLSGLLDKLITDELYANVPVADQLATILSGIGELAQTITVGETLTVHTPKADGSVAVDQQVASLGFTLAGQSTQIALDATAQAQARATLAGTIAPHADAPIADADLTLAGGGLTLPFGALVLQAASPLLFAPLGASDLQGALVTLVPCAAAAQSIADGLGGFLPASTIDAVCTTALGLVASAVTGELDKLTLAGVSVDHGSATLLDASPAHPTADHQSDAIAGGKWDWHFTLAGQALTVPTTLEANRVGTAQ